MKPQSKSVEGDAQLEEKNVQNKQECTHCENKEASDYENADSEGDSAESEEDSTKSNDESTASDNESTASDNESTASDNESTASDNESTTSDNESTTSDNESTALYIESTASENESTALYIESTASENEGTASDNESTASDNKSTALYIECTASENESTASDNKRTDPEDESTEPEDKSNTPEDESNTPEETDEKSGEDSDIEDDHAYETPPPHRRLLRLSSDSSLDDCRRTDIAELTSVHYTYRLNVAEQTVGQPNLDDGTAEAHGHFDGYDQARSTYFDVLQCEEYSKDIFVYLQMRERLYPHSHDELINVIAEQPYATLKRRQDAIDLIAAIADWISLDGEITHLAAKLFDTFLRKNLVDDERSWNSLICSVLYVAEKYISNRDILLEKFTKVFPVHEFTCKDFLEMELKILKACGFNLGMPLAIGFLDMYSTVEKLVSKTRHLANYILELSLLDCKTACLPESKLAAAALFIANRMTGHQGWTDNLKSFTGYRRDDIAFEICLVNGFFISLKQPTEDDYTFRIESIYLKEYNNEVAKIVKLPTMGEDLWI